MSRDHHQAGPSHGCHARQSGRAQEHAGQDQRSSPPGPVLCGRRGRASQVSGHINIHIRNVLEEHELSAEATIKEYLIVYQEGQRQVQRPVKYYNLDMILAVGYRVRSPRGVMFRQWATERLREYLIKGFTLDYERLKGGNSYSTCRPHRLLSG